MQEAINKLQSEMDSNKNNPYVKVIGEFLVWHVKANPSAADLIMDRNKSIAKSLDAMKKEAQKKATNGMAMLTDAEGFAIVLKYFEIQDNPVSEDKLSPAKAETSNFDVKLEDFL